MNPMKLSIVIPLFNEAPSVSHLVDALKNALAKQSKYEIIIVDDGSKDATWNELSKCGETFPELKSIRLFRNAGQTTALQAGIDASSGEIVVTLDGDLENNPADIDRLLEKLDEGYDVVSGWRKDRWKGNTFTRRIPSKIANALISYMTGLKLHDYGCTLKAYRREYLTPLRLYGEMHRFIPAYASWYGARIAEIPVRYTPRRFGKSHYGMGRIFRVLLDLLLIRFLEKYMHRPIHFFGGAGAISLAIGGVAGFLAIVLKIIHLRDFVSTPLPIFSAMFLIIGIQFILMGILAEILMRTYFESQGRTTYIIREKINF